MKINKVFIIIYLATLSALVWYNLSHAVVNDGVKEYQTYLLNIENGWVFRQTLINSCLVTTWIPSLIQRLTGWDSMIIFRVFPTIFYALMPAFVYLIAKRYLSARYAIVTVLVVVLNSHFLYFPDIGRVGVAIGFMAGMMWALLEKRLIWAGMFALLVVFSHYGTSLIAVGIVGVATFVPLVWKRRVVRHYLVVFCLLFVVVGIWHFGVAAYSGKVMFQTLFQTEQTGQILPQYPLLDPTTEENPLLDPTTREPAVQEAIGLNISDMTTPKKIEVIANWLVVLIISLGLYYVTRNKKIDGQFKIMSLAFWGLILFTIAIPWLSVYYGGMRVYFTATVLLAICFPLGAEKIAKKMRIPPLLLMAVVLVLYALSTSGVIYLPFGLAKTFPVAVTLP